MLGRVEKAFRCGETVSMHARLCGMVLLAMAAMVLNACTAADHRAGTRTYPAPVATQSPRMHTGGTLPPHSVESAQPDFAGIGPLHFGMNAAQMKQAWGKALYGEAPTNDPQACYYLRPRKDDYRLLFMMEGDRFVLLNVKTDSKTAPDGGRVGMDAQEIEKLYAGRVHVTPGKYDPATKILSVSSHIKDASLVFEADTSGVVKSWRIGVAPQIDYVEGCS